jgi:hypothetical protein
VLRDENAPALAFACNGSLNANAPLTERPVAFADGSLTDSVASPAALITVAVIDLPAALRAIFHNDQEHPGLARLFAVFVAEGLHPDHPTHDHFRQRNARGRTTLTEVIRRRQIRGEITDQHEPEAIAIALLALLNGLNLGQVLEPDIDHAAALDAVLCLLFT